MPKIPVTFDDVKTLAERSKTKTLGDSDLIAVEIAQEIKGLTKEDALETLGINDLDGRVQVLDENKADKATTYTKTEVDVTIDALDGRLDTLEGTGEGSVAKAIDDAVSPLEEDIADLAGSGRTTETVYDNAQAILLKADKATTYTKAENDAQLLLKADKADTYTKTEVNNTINAIDGRVQYLEETGGPPGPQGEQGPQGPEGEQGPKGEDGEKGDDGLSAYEVAVKEGFVGNETAWLASLKGADGQDGAKGADGEQGEEGKSAYDIYVETTSDSPVKTEEQWLASLKGADGEQGADGKSAYEYAEEEGYEGTEGEFAEALADVENKVDKSKIITSFNSGIGLDNTQVPSALLVYNSLDGGGGGEDVKWRKGVVVIGSASQVSEGLADMSWEEITADNEMWGFFWHGIRISGASVKFLKGEYEIPTNIYFGENDDGRFAIPCGVAKIEGAGEDTVIAVGYPAGGTAFLSTTKHDGRKGAFCHISNLKIVNTGMTTFGVVTQAEDGSGSVVENVIVEDMIAVGILASWDVKNVTFRNCTTINCGSAFAGEQAAGIGVTSVDNWTPSNIKIDGCTVIGGAYAGIGIVNAEDCKVVNCHVEDYGKIGAGAIGGERNIFANNTIIRDTQADPQAGEFGILLNETDRAIVVGNIVENAYIMNNDSGGCVIENNIGDVL